MKIFFALVFVNYIFATDSPFSGFYLGKQVGLNALVAAKNSVSIFPGVNKGSDEKFKARGNLGAHTLLVGWYGGYGSIINAYYVGIEAYCNCNQNNMILTKTKEESQKFTNTFNAGGKVRIGYFLCEDMMLYVGMGTEYSKWQLKTIKANPLINYDNTHVSATQLHFAYALGVENHLNEVIFLRGEYAYVNGPKIRLRSDMPISSTVKIDAGQHRFTGSIGYRF